MNFGPPDGNERRGEDDTRIEEADAVDGWHDEGVLRVLQAARAAVSALQTLREVAACAATDVLRVWLVGVGMGAVERARQGVHLDGGAPAHASGLRRGPPVCAGCRGVGRRCPDG